MSELVSQWLSAEHTMTGFDCGVPELNHWLRTQRAGHSRTKVWVRRRGNRVLGYYTMSPYLQERSADGLTRRFHEEFKHIPGYLLGKLWVYPHDHAWSARHPPKKRRAIPAASPVI